MLQIAANPYVTILGPERTASSRLNLSQAFNSFGTTIGPIIGGFLVFTYFTTKEGSTGADSVQITLLLCFARCVCAAGYFVLSLRMFPAFTNTEAVGRGLGALKHPHTALGMLAIFMYVGGEVTVGAPLSYFLGTPQTGRLCRTSSCDQVSLLLSGAV